MDSHHVGTDEQGKHYVHIFSSNLLKDSDRPGLKRVLILPEGVGGKISRQGGDFKSLSKGSVRSILDYFKHRGVSMVVDYEHQSEFGKFTSPTGLAEAAGWVEHLEYVKGEGIVGHVKWTNDAAQRIRDDKYRYLSPTTIHDKKTGEIAFVKSLALVNQPAIDHVPKVAASHRMTEKEKMTTATKEHEELAADSRVAIAVKSMLGLDDDADEQTTLTALGRVCVSALRNAEQDHDVRNFLQPYVIKGVVDPDANTQTMRDDYRDMVALASANRDLCKKVLDQRVSRLPAQGRTKAPAASGGDDRRSIITSAARDFEADPRHGKITSKAAFVNMKLIDAGKDVLKADEKGLLEN